MLEMLAGWEVDVERGPNWLFVKLKAPEEGACKAPPLAERLELLLREHLVNRIVLELGEVGPLNRHILAQFVLLKKRIRKDGGLIRLCGLSPSNQETLCRCRLDRLFPNYQNREEAVMGSSVPRQPR